MRTHTVVGPKVLNALLAAREFMGFSASSVVGRGLVTGVLVGTTTTHPVEASVPSSGRAFTTFFPSS